MKSKLQYLPALWQRIDFFDTAIMFQFCLHKTNTVHVISQCRNPLTHSVDDSLWDFNGLFLGIPANRCITCSDYMQSSHRHVTGI